MDTPPRPHQEAASSQLGERPAGFTKLHKLASDTACVAGPGSQKQGQGGEALLRVLPCLGNLGAPEPLPAATAG